MRSAPALALSLFAAAVASAQPANDECVSAEAISGLGAFAFDTSAASTDGLNHAVCTFFGSGAIFNDVWFRWTADRAGETSIETCGGAAFDTKIAVYDELDCLSGADPVACSDDNCGLQTRVSLGAVNGRTYLIRVGSFAAGGRGLGTLTIAGPLAAGPIVSPLNGASYYVVTPGSWTRAEAVAVSLGGHLATVGDGAENEWIRANVLGFDGADRRGWIGLNDRDAEGAFAWTSGEAVAYTNWNGGEPNDSRGMEDFAEMFGSNGLWNDNADNPPIAVFGIVEVAGGPACIADVDDDGDFGNGASPDGGVTIEDLLFYLGAFDAGDIAADVDDDGADPANPDLGVTIEDLLYFLVRFDRGC